MINEHLTDWPNLDPKEIKGIRKDVDNIIKYCNMLTVKKSNLHHVEFFDLLVLEAGKRLDVYRKQEEK